MSIPVSYADFQAHDSRLVEDGGPWRTELSTDAFCDSVPPDFCLDYIRCVGCVVFIYGSTRTYTSKFLVNISIPMAQYGNANTLDFTFGYNLAWMSNYTAPGTPLSSRLTVGSTSFTDNFVSTRYFGASLGDPFYHSGTTNLAKSPDGALGYIPITIDFSFTRELNSDTEWWMKGLGLQITTQTTSGSVASASSSMGSSLSSSSSISGSSQTSRYPSSSLSNVALPGISQPSTASDIFGVSVASTSLPNSNDSLTDKKSTPAIVGGVVGGCVLLGALAIFLLLLYRKKIQRLKHRHLSWQHKDENTGFERMGGGELIRTPYLERPLPSPARHIDASKSPSSPDTLNSRANPDSIVSSITSASSPVIPSNRCGRSNSQNSDPRINPSHGYERHQSISNYPSTLHPEVPPPAYSDVNENTDDHGHGNERRRRRG